MGCGIGHEKRKLGIGIIIRDHSGAVVACLSAAENFLSNAILAGSRALGRALIFCEELDLEKDIMEGDTQVVIQNANKEEACTAWYGTVIKDVKLALKSGPNWSLCFNYRKFIAAAHALAKSGLCNDNFETVCLEETPSVITSIVIADLSM